MNNLLKYRVIIYLSIFITFTSCKGQEKEQANKSVTNNQTTITQSGIYYYKPNLKSIDSLKKSMGEDDFYSIADDNNAYFSEILQKLDNNIIKLKTNSVYFKNENITIKIDSLKNNWGILEYNRGNKHKVFSFVDYNLLLNDRDQNYNVIENKDSIRIDKTSLFINQKEYQGLIINEMALNTSLKIIDPNTFYLIYEYTASSTKQRVAYKYYHEKETYLIYKESIIFGREGIKSNRIYFEDYKLSNTNFETLEAINFNKKFLFSPINYKA
ncbi:hypothetical protein FLGE108171_13215 [Flavobacterium gelidilacus]|uniref:hypothetical protein n=1 Tax=Flavobacterium gelidilacus TaxID=206041 RepID=UPI00047EA368|nr:hypothetical protein [Flavobacterium gelidilacus]